MRWKGKMSQLAGRSRGAEISQGWQKKETISFIDSASIYQASSCVRHSVRCWGTSIRWASLSRKSSSGGEMLNIKINGDLHGQAFLGEVMGHKRQFL